MKNKRNTLRSPFHEYSISRGEHFISTENEYTGGDHNDFFSSDLIFSVNRKKCSDKIHLFKVFRSECSDISNLCKSAQFEVLSSSLSIKDALSAKVNR